MFILLKRVYYFSIGLFFIVNQFIWSQDQRVADSLAVVYSKDILAGEERLELLRNLSFNETSDNLLALKYAEELIALSEAANNQFYIYSGYLQKGFKLKAIGELEKALTAFFKSAKIAVEIENNSYEGTAHMAIADVYAVMGNKTNSEMYYNKSINLLRKTKDGIFLASAILNAGDNYFNNKKYD
jgi:tetratricopeptide (TPR) repeat protein